MSIQDIKEQAEREIAEENRRKAVDEYKARLRIKKTVWEKIFPIKIIITRR